MKADTIIAQCRMRFAAGLPFMRPVFGPLPKKCGRLNRKPSQEAFGGSLHEFATEIKGSKLLDKDRFRWAAQETGTLPDVVRRNHAKAFLTKKLTKKVPSRSEFTAYGQASLLLARSIFRLLDLLSKGNIHD